jgi:hypothetical protein
MAVVNLTRIMHVRLDIRLRSLGRFNRHVIEAQTNGCGSSLGLGAAEPALSLITTDFAKRNQS